MITIEELILSPGTKKYVLPHNTPKIKLLPQLQPVIPKPDKYTYSAALSKSIQNLNNNDQRK